MIKKGGFTLIEIMVVMLILGILAAIAVPSYSNYIQQGAAEASQNNLLTLYAAQKNYYFTNGSYCINSGANPSCGMNLEHLNFNLKLNITDTNYAYSCSAGTSPNTVICTATKNGTQITLCYPTPTPPATCQSSCLPRCVGAACGESDGCGGICSSGACATGYSCNSSGKCAACTQNCNDGQCHSDSYSYCSQSCMANCVSPSSCDSTGKCTQCIPNCSDHCSTSSSSDGCGGTCPACTTSCNGNVCAGGTGNYSYNCTPPCPQGQECNNGTCCSPSTCPSSSPTCTTNSCGPSCACPFDAALGQAVCTTSGTCCYPNCWPQSTGCHDTNYLDYDGCGVVCPKNCDHCNANGICASGCVTDCQEAFCGDDGCGGSCGTCPSGESCDENQLCDPICSPGQILNAPYNGQCVQCNPNCSSTGTPCGNDGCGGSCGTCPSGQICNADASGQCVPSVPCVPDCVDAQCGDDGCGGSCGTCSSGQMCDWNGQCILTCASRGVVCGDDGDGGSCGTCPGGQICNASGQCIDCTPYCPSNVQCGGDNGCGGSCGICSVGQTCNASNQCVNSSTGGNNSCTPNCEDGQCHSSSYSDGCGGTCPPVACNTGFTCTSGQCVISCFPNCNDGLCHTSNYTDITTPTPCGTNDCIRNCKSPGTCANGDGQAGSCSTSCTVNCNDCGSAPCCHATSYTDSNNCATNDCLPTCTAPDSCNGSGQCCDTNGHCTTTSA